MPYVFISRAESRVSRALIGRERTRARRAVDVLAGSDPVEVARKLGMRVHTIRAILSRRMLPGARFLECAVRVLPAF